MTTVTTVGMGLCHWDEPQPPALAKWGVHDKSKLISNLKTLLACNLSVSEQNATSSANSGHIIGLYWLLLRPNNSK
jgi:hypothetical protein